MKWVWEMDDAIQNFAKHVAKWSFDLVVSPVKYIEDQLYDLLTGSWICDHLGWHKYDLAWTGKKDKIVVVCKRCGHNKWENDNASN